MDLKSVDLIKLGVKFKSLKGEMYFEVEALKKKFKNLVIQDVDVVEIDGMNMVKLSDVDASNAKQTKK